MHDQADDVGYWIGFDTMIGYENRLLGAQDRFAIASGDRVVVIAAEP